jgi:hypothetical protein
MILATVDTRNFTFTAVGNDRDHANKVLTAGWNAHVREYGADPDMMTHMIDDEEVNYTPLVVGQCRRDHEYLSGERG